MSKQDMDDMNSGDESDRDLIYTEMLEYICDRSQNHMNANRREARYKIQSEWKGASKATQIMGKGLHKLFLTVVKKVL